MKKVIVIGAGISGLAAAIYAQKSGFDVTLCEQHNMAGGMCTSWKCKGYLIEGAIHWLTGSSPKTECYKLWEETGALNENVKVFLPDPFSAIEWEGQTINLYRDIKKTVQQLIALSPKDKKRLRGLVKDVKAFSSMQMPVYDIKDLKAQNPKRMDLGTLLKMLPALPKVGRLGNMSCKEYVERFEHPAIKRLFRIMPGEYSATSLVATLATLDTGDGGYPEGGSLGMVDRMRKNFEDLGGKLLLSTQVQKINIEKGNEKSIVTGVTLANGTLAADAVIVTQETIAALDRLFETPLEDAWLKEIRETTKPAVCTFVGVGIRAKISQTPIPTWELDEPITYAGMSIPEIAFHNYALHDYAPKGCTTLTTAFMGDTYDFWKKAKDEGRYEEEKRALADQISRVICKKFPEAKDNIEIIDIATPLSYERYTGAYHGSWMSIMGAGDKMKMYPGSVKDVSGLFFAGHRLMSPGGLPVAIVSGRKAAQMVCREFGVMFIGAKSIPLK